MSIVAIEINPTRILLVAGRKAASRPLEVSHVIEIPLVKDPSDEEISELLKEQVVAHGFSRHEAIVVLSRSQSELREIELPPAPTEELPDMVMFKAKSDFASFNDRWLLDYVLLDEDETKPRKVLASAISPEVSERVKKIVEPSGLKLKQMVLRPFAVMDLLRSKTKDDKARLVVSPGDNFTDIVVTKGSQTVSTRSIRMSAGHTADQRSQQLVSEVRRTIASSKRPLGGAKVEGLVLLDDEKKNRHLVGNLGERLGLDVDVVNPFDGLDRIGQARDSVEAPWQYSPLLGSMVDHGTDYAPAIDFLNPSRKAEVVVDRRRWWLYGALAGLAVAMTIFFGWWKLSSQKAEIARLNDDLTSAISLNAGSDSRPSVDEQLKRIEKIDNWQKANIQWLDELDEISNRFLTADEVVVSKFDAKLLRETPVVEVTGKVVSNSEEKVLFKSLESRPYNVTPNKPSVGDSDYPVGFGGLLKIEQKGRKWLSNIDAHVESFDKADSNLQEEPAAEGSVN